MVMDYKFDILETNTKGKILNNRSIYDYFNQRGIEENGMLYNIINKLDDEGSIVLSFGEGDTSLMLVGGVHGNELPPQIALLEFIEELYNDKKWDLNCKLYIAPCLIPRATMINSRYLNSIDMNRHAQADGVTKKIIDFAVEHDVISLCDCHATDPYNKPGVNSIFCSVQPLIESCYIAEYVAQITSSKLLPTAQAGKVISGAVEDEANLRGISSITCEVVSPVGDLCECSVELCSNQFLSFLNYFNAISLKK